MKFEQYYAEAKSYVAACEERMKTKPEPKGQKFPIGTRVRIADDLGQSMDHFPGKGCCATVKYTYAHALGGDDITSYCLDIDDYGEVSWYEEHQLTEITEKER